MTEMHLKCVQLLPLQEMALRRVAVLLWTGSDILADFLKLKLQPDNIFTQQKYLKPIENKVKDKVVKLGLPESLTKQMIEVVQPIGMKICKWDYHEDAAFYFPNKFSLSVLSKLCWTAAGAIDDRKTAEGLVRCDALSVERRYEIACRNCLEDHIPLLWEELPEMEKRIFNNRKRVALEYCWPHILSGKLSNLNDVWRTSDRNLISFNQWAFEYSAGEGNKTAAHYFFKKLTYGEREASIVRTALAVAGRNHYYKFGYYLNTLCYLLSLMTPEQQMEVLNARPADVFLCFLHWPRQNLFLHNAWIVLNFVPPTRHAELLHAMAGELASLDFYFPKLVHEFFRQIPLHLKKVFVDEAYFPACRFLCMFFKFDDSDSIKVLFRNVDAADRVKIVFNDGVLKFLLINIFVSRWALVKLCLREAAPSREDRERLKDRLMSYCNQRILAPALLEKEKLKSFFNSLEKSDARAAKEKKAVKRKLENGCLEKFTILLLKRNTGVYAFL